MPTVTYRAAVGVAALLAGAYATGRAFRRIVQGQPRGRLSFRDKSVLITGGSRGLGIELARELIREGARVSLCARDSAELERARDELSNVHDDVLTFTCDIRDREQVNALVEQVAERHGDVDVLINNAGLIRVGPLDAMTLDDFEELMGVHFWAPLYTTLAVLPAMRRKKAGTIVNIASIGGKIAVPHLLPYSASKFALAGLSDGLRAELLAEGIRVTCVYPGLMRTGSHLQAEFKSRHKKEFAWFSISDSLPGLSMDSRRAARKILAAVRRGDAEVIVGLPAKAAALARALFPETVAAALERTNRMLPDYGGIGQEVRKGYESASQASPSRITILSDEAARRNNERGGMEAASASAVVH